MARPLPILLALTSSLLLVPFAPHPAAAQDAQGFLSRPATPGGQEITLPVNTGQTVTLTSRAATVFVANPEVADIQVPAGGKSFFVFGKAAGRTSVFALSEEGRQLATYSVVIQQPIGDLQGRMLDEFPGSQIQVRSTPGGVVLSGQVESPAAAEHAASVAKLFIGEKQSVVNQLRVSASTQVHLRVRVAEVSRETLKELGINLQTFFNVGAAQFGIVSGRDFLNNQGQLIQTVSGAAMLPGAYRSANGRVDLNAVIDALARDNVISILAEPSLTALSGETASFLAGGEFPIPISTALGELHVEFKRFGVALDFTPTVLSAGRISLKVRPEVSELAQSGAVVVNGTAFPSLNVRRAETTVELGSGQSFAIAGLFRNETRTAADRVPGLGEVPVLGSLFRSSNFRRNESELVILVTPYVVHPVSAGLTAPTDRFAPASDLERIFLGRLNRTADAGTVPALGPGGLRLHGAAGFTLD